MYLILKRDKNFGTEGILNSSTQYSTYGHFGIGLPALCKGCMPQIVFYVMFVIYFGRVL